MDSLASNLPCPSYGRRPRALLASAGVKLLDPRDLLAGSALSWLGGCATTAKGDLMPKGMAKVKPTFHVWKLL